MISSIAAVMLLAGLVAGSNDKGFHPGPAATYAHQQSDDVVIGARIYDSPELIEEAFGKKIDMAKYGVLPVLLVVQNDRKQSVDLRSIEVNIVSSDGRHATSVKAEELPYLAATGKRPAQVPLSIPISIKRKNPLAAPEISERAFTAAMLAPGESASGFFYFEAHAEPEDQVYVSGLQETPSGRDITYFEFPVVKE